MPNIFDQFDAPAASAPVRQSRNIFDQFDDMPSPVQIAAQSMQAAGSVPQQERAPPRDIGTAQGWLEQIENVSRGIGQRTNPNVYHGDGQNLRTPLGEITAEGDEGLFYGSADQRTLVNPKTDVVLRDPSSGRLMAYRRSAEWEEGGVAGLSRLATQGMAAGSPVGPARTAAGTVGTQTGSAIATQRAADIAADSQAFANLGVRPFGPAFSQGPVASVAKQLTETPVIGAPARNALEETLTNTRDAANQIAGRMSPVTAYDEAGVTLQRGLERFRGAQLADLEPGVVQGMGINPNSAVPRPQVMSGGAARAAEEAAPVRQQIGATTAQTTRGVDVPAARPLSQTLTARTTAEQLDDDALTRVIRAPAGETSFATRQEALYERAWRMVPELQRIDGTTNPNMIAAVNTRHALGQIDNAIASQIAGQGTITGELADRIRNARAANFQLADLRAIRTEVGRALSNTNPLQQTLNRGQLMGLYGALSRDIETGLETLANRAAIATQRGGNRPDRATIDAARQASSALHAFRTADRYTRQGMGRIERFLKVVGADKPEAAAKRLVQAALSQGRGDIGMLRSAHAALRPEEWADFSSLVLRELGQPVGSARGMTSDLGFSVSSFMTRWNNMDPRARALIFGSREHSQAIDDLVRVANRMANVEATYNTSRSATNALNVGGVFATGGAIMSGADAGLTLLGSAGAGLAASVLLSRPQYVRWATRYAQLRAAALRAPNRANPAMIAHVRRLEELARANPALISVVRAAREDGVVERRNGNQEE